MQTRSLLVRFAALPLTTLTFTLLTSVNSQAQITVDGTRDAAYGTPLAVQTVTSGWGAGNVLASLSAKQEGGSLKLFLAGRPDGNAFILFIDSRSGGANVLVNNLITGGGEEYAINNFGTSSTAGMTFESGFAPDFAIRIHGGGWTALYPLAPGSSRSYLGQSTVATVAGGPVTALRTVYNNVTGNYADHTTGVEIDLSLAALGVPASSGQPVKFMAILINEGSSYASNQTLGSLPAGSGDLASGFNTTNFDTVSGTQTISITVDNNDSDGDGIPDATDPDDDNDGLPDTVETNTGIFVDSDDTGTNPLVADTDGDGVNDGAEVTAGTDPNKRNYASMLIAGDFLTPTWSDTPTAENTMSPVSGDEFGWQIDRLFTASSPIKFKFLAGSWSTNWGLSGSSGTASPNGGDISITPGTGVFRFYFNTDTLSYSLTRATFATYAEFAAAYGLTGGPLDDDDIDGLTNEQEFDANTNPLASDSDGDGLSDSSEVDGSAASANLGANVPTNPLLADTDGDGLRDDWEISYFLDPTDNGTASPYENYIPSEIGLDIQTNPNGADADPDNDGLTNLQEFAAGTSPLAAGSGFVANNAKITIPGAFNGWDAEGTPANTMVLVGNFSWKSLLYFSAPPAEGRFKFAAGSWSKNWGSGPTPGVAVLEGGDIIGTGTFTAAGYYAVTFNDFSLAYTLSPLSATDIDADGLPDEYEAFYGGQLSTPTTDLDPAVDYNSDGKTTAQNFADGTNPVKDVVAPTVALAAGIDRVTWYDLGATIPAPAESDVVATDDITSSPTITILSPAPDNSVDGLNTIIYQAEDEAGNYTLFRRVIAVGNAAPGFYNLRFPATMTVNILSSDYAYGEIYIDGATAGSGQATGVQAWVGVNTSNTDPSTWDASAWTAANYVGEEGNNDNYQGQISGTGRTPGTYYYATRFQLGTNSSNTNYFYGGIGSDGNGGNWGGTREVVTSGVTNTVTNGNGVLTVQNARTIGFGVNMNVQNNKSLFDPATQGVELRGSFNQWAGGTTLTDTNNDGVYEGTFVIAGEQGETVEYKFYRTGGSNEGYEGIANNRSLTLGPSGQEDFTDGVYFNNDDGVGPIITLIGANPLNLAVGDSYTELGANAFDSIDGSLTATPSGSVNTAVPGEYTITYNASDAAGNEGTPVTRTVIVAAASGSNFGSWSGNGEVNSANLLKYAIGGASGLAADDGEAPATSVTSSNLSITAIVRTDDPKLEVVGETVTNLTGSWGTNGVTVTGANDGVSQDGVGNGLERKTFSVERGSDTRRFIRIKGILNP